MIRLRSNWKNDGTAFEEEIKLVCTQYQRARVATIEKVSPPTRVIGGGATKHVIMMENPFLDFVGVWTARNGQGIFFEAKSTATHLLRLGKDGGLTQAQFSSLMKWKLAGAETFVLWRFGGRTVIFTAKMMAAAGVKGDASLAFENGIPVPATARTHIDFLAIIDGLQG